MMPLISIQLEALSSPMSTMDWWIQILLYILTLFLIGISYLFYKHWRTRHLLRDFPTVTWRPRFITYQYGDLNKMPSSAITNILPRMARLGGPYGSYGTVYGISTPVIHIAHPVPAQAVLQDAPPSVSTSTGAKQRRTSVAHASGACKSPAYNHFLNFSGHGVFSADGEEWRQKRASVLHCLMVRSGNRIEAEALQSAKELVLDFRNLQDNVVNVVPVLQKATLTLIYRYLTHSNPPEKLLPPYLSAITQIRMILLAQSRSVWFLLPRWSYVWFSGLYRDEERVLEPIRQFSAQALQVAKPESPLSQLRAKSSHGSQQDLLDEAVTLLFAGQDTGAATLSWTLHLLSLHKDIQDRLAKEVRQPNNDLTKLPLLDAVIKESMRLYPVAPFVVRKCVQNILLSDTVTLPREALACIWIYSLHRNPDIWKDRPNSFVPERWLSGDLTKLERSAFMPFCAGPRNCLGQPMAHVWLRILLGTLIQTFEFIDERLESAGRHDTAEDPEDFYLDMQAGFTVLPVGGVNLRVRQR